MKNREKKTTYIYLYRHLDKGYHIDYCFIKGKRIKDFQVLCDPRGSTIQTISLFYVEL